MQSTNDKLENLNKTSQMKCAYVTCLPKHDHLIKEIGRVRYRRRIIEELTEIYYTGCASNIIFPSA